jgi:hypothetical protein
MVNWYKEELLTWKNCLQAICKNWCTYERGHNSHIMNNLTVMGIGITQDISAAKQDCSYNKSLCNCKERRCKNRKTNCFWISSS